MRPDPVGRVLGLPPAVVDRVDVVRSVPVRMRDGVILRGDHYAPRTDTACPTVLVRTPYGRGGPVGLLCRAVARRGFHVLLQSCRGTGDAGGDFEPMLHEREDGLDTLDWLRHQRWYDGRLVTYGPSYVGFVQWALAAEAGDELKAMATIVTAADFGRSTHAGGAFSLDTVLTWSNIVSAQRNPGLAQTVELLRGQPRLRAGLAHLPLAEADRVTTGAEVAFFQRWLVERDPTGAYWSERGHRHRLPDIAAPVLMIGGWYDIFLPWQVDDYLALRAAGHRPHLTIGPWHHGSPGLFRHSAAEAVAWFQSHTSGGTVQPRALPVRLHVGGADEWREYADWPVPGGTTRQWHALPDGALDLTGDAPPEDDVVVGAFTYDPQDPTPALGGPRLIGKIAGRRDNRELEARPDVVTFTSAPLAAPVEVIGPVSATVRVRADAPHFDVFVRLCDVDPDGRSWNLCDGLTRVDGTRSGEVRVELWPAAHRFHPGHRVRVQVSGGAHPRFSRNPGTGAPLGQEHELVRVRQELLSPTRLEVLLHTPADQSSKVDGPTSR